MKNVFDKAFVLGYRDGYHGEAYKHGWEAGFLSRVEEKEAQYA